jgi:hypothetical protein
MGISPGSMTTAASVCKNVVSCLLDYGVSELVGCNV